MGIKRTTAHISHRGTQGQHGGASIGGALFSDDCADRPTRRPPKPTPSCTPPRLVPPQDPCPWGTAREWAGTLQCADSPVLHRLQPNFWPVLFFIPPTPAFPGRALPSICFKIASCPQKLSSPDSLQRPRVDKPTYFPVTTTPLQTESSEPLLGNFQSRFAFSTIHPHSTLAVTLEESLAWKERIEDHPR